MNHKTDSQKILSPIFLLTFILSFQISYSFHWDGNILYDLETNTLSDFTAETADWTLSSYVTTGVKYYNCAGNYILGGYNVLGGAAGQYYQRIYSSLPTHNQIYLQMTFYQIDSWDPGNDYFSIDIDGTSFSGWYLYYSYPGTYSLCGSTVNSDYYDFVFTMSLTYPHSASSLTFKMISGADQASSDESFGFRDLKIEFLTNTSPYFSLCAPGVPSSYLSASRCSTSCTSSGNSISPANYGFCFPTSSCSTNCNRCYDTTALCTSCPTGSFLGGTACYSACDYPLSTNMLGGVTYCETSCSAGEYTWWDASCSSLCSYTTSYGSYGSYAMVGTTISSFLECQYPCATSQFLSWNTSCLSSCPSPLITTIYKSRNFCEYPCASSEYLYWNGSCISTCPSLLSSETQGTSQQRNFCWYTCSETQYLYWNGSCLDTCPSPLISETQSSSQPRKFCWYPCQPYEYLFWNGSCIATCPSPLSSETQGTSQERNFCWYTCSETQYLYWNGSCIDSCPSPLTAEIQGASLQIKFCWYPCQPSEYLYWNGSCINNCPSPLSPEIQGLTEQRNFCWYTCQPSEFLYWNQSCLTTCPVPLLTFNYSGNQFCFLPCSTPNIYWYQDFSCRSECLLPYNPILHDSVSQCLKPCTKSSEWFYDLEEECHDTCNPPYVRQIINTIPVCHIDSATLASETNKVKTTAQIIETLGKVTSTILKAASIPQVSTPRTPLLAQISGLMQYVRYMDIDYPWRVELFFQSNDANLISLNIDFSIPNKIQEKFDNYPLPAVFEKYSLDSNFINNMWDLINTVLLVILITFVLLIFKPIVKKNFKANHLRTRILQSLKWNIPISMISGGVGEIIFYASLQVRNTPLNSAISFVSFFISLIMISWIIVIFAICLKLLRGFRLQKQKIIPSTPSKSKGWLEKWKGYEILYEEIEERSLFSLAYMVVYIVRALLFFAIIANLYDYPLTQSILINVINLMIFLYLLTYKPLKDIWNTIQLLINEILGDILTVCVLIFAIMDRAGIEANSSRVTIGNIMIVIMLIFYILGVVFLVIEGILFSIEAYKTWKEMRARGIKSPLKMLQILIFGEAKPDYKETTLELSHIKITPAETNNVDVKERNFSIMDDIPMDSTTRFFLPIRRVNLIGTESEVQNTEDEIEVSRVHRPFRRIPQKQDESLSKEMNPDDKTSGLTLSNIEPTLQPNVDFIRNWGNLKARMKRFNQSSIHQVQWSNEE